MLKVDWFEIPVSDMLRAKSFYGELFKCEFVDNKIGDSTHMAIIKTESATPGALMFNPEFYKPSTDGVLLYLRVKSIDAIASKVTHLKGKIMIEKRQISKEMGYMAIIKDSEGNRIALLADS